MQKPVAVALWLVAIAIPLLVVVAGNWMFWTLTARPERFLDEPDVVAMQLLFAAAPFVGLAGWASRGTVATDERRRRGLLLAAMSGIVVCVALWSLFYYGGYADWRDRATGGANIGLGLLMLASPFLVGLAMTFAYRHSNRPGGQGGEA